MSYIITPSIVINPTAQSAIEPAKAFFAWATGESASGARGNRVLLPNALTQRVMAETDAGSNIVTCKDLDDLFAKLDA